MEFVIHGVCAIGEELAPGLGSSRVGLPVVFGRDRDPEGQIMKCVHIFPVVHQRFGNVPPITEMYRLTIDLDALAERLGNKAFYAKNQRAVMAFGDVTCQIEPVHPPSTVLVP
jgi:hypothetical protein